MARPAGAITRLTRGVVSSWTIIHALPRSPHERVCYSQRIERGMSRIRITRAGAPATIAFSGTSLVTTELVPTMLLSPIVTPRSTHAP
jgi:hypothetical protein